MQIQGSGSASAQFNSSFSSRVVAKTEQRAGGDGLQTEARAASFVRNEPSAAPAAKPSAPATKPLVPALVEEQIAAAKKPAPVESPVAWMSASGRVSVSPVGSGNAGVDRSVRDRAGFVKVDADTLKANVDKQFAPKPSDSPELQVLKQVFAAWAKKSIEAEMTPPNSVFRK
jgi:hypothetical protein